MVAVMQLKPKRLVVLLELVVVVVYTQDVSVLVPLPLFGG
jgi:hypothetical protein